MTEIYDCELCNNKLEIPQDKQDSELILCENCIYQKDELKTNTY